MFIKIIVVLLFLKQIFMLRVANSIIKKRSSISCGIDNTNISAVYEGSASIVDYPWMGILYYPTGIETYTTSVVLVTRQLVIASAFEIDKIPNGEIRKYAKVILGHQCGKGTPIGIRDYTNHPDFKETYSALTIVQLDIDHVTQKLQPICSPPTHFENPQLYAMTVVGGCYNAKVKIYKMQYVDIKRCQMFYRKYEIDMASFWPTNTACARAVSGGKCLFRSGTALVMKQDGRWRLLGFGIYGPGCRAPARFLDYGMYHQWIVTAVTRTGMPAVTRIASNHLVMRRKLSSIQRFGLCDKEEMANLIYTDQIILRTGTERGVAYYNLTLATNVEYQCVVLRAKHLKPTYEKDANGTLIKPLLKKNPRIYLRRWCTEPQYFCFGFQYIEIQFYVEIHFSFQTEFTFYSYGKYPVVIDPIAVMRVANTQTDLTTQKIPKYEELLNNLEEMREQDDTWWFFNT